MTKLSEADYRSCRLEPKLEKLGYPHRDLNICRRHARFKDYSGSYSLDYLFFIENKPILNIEAKPYESQFNTVYGQATYYARNFEPTKTIPYIICAAGLKIEMYKAMPSRNGIGVEFEKLGRLLNWKDLLSVVKPAIKPTTVEAATRTTLGLESLKMVYSEIFEALKQNRPKLKHEDNIVLVMNEILKAVIQAQDIKGIFEKNRLTQGTIARIEEVLHWYPLTKIEGHNLAYAYREFITRSFTGTMPSWAGEREIGRYLTPASVIKFMVELCNPQPADKVIDFACGSGGFLGAIASLMVAKTNLNRYLKEKLFACDADRFSISTAKTFMELLLPGKQSLAETFEESFYSKSLKPGSQIGLGDAYPEVGPTPRLPFGLNKTEGVLNIFHHNGLFSKKIHSWERDLSSITRDGEFDMVISNPPGGTEYNLEHETELKSLFPLERGKKKLQNAPLFIQRAIQLAKKDGKICLIVPDGILANIQLQYLQKYIFNCCRVEAVISLPRGIFPNVPSKMSIIYMIKTDKPTIKREPFLAAVITGIDPETGEPRNLETELDQILSMYRKE